MIDKNFSKISRLKCLFIVDSFLAKGGAESTIIKLIKYLPKVFPIDIYFSALSSNQKMISLVENDIKDILPLSSYSFFSKPLFYNLKNLISFIRRNNIGFIMSFYEGSDFLTFLIKKMFPQIVVFSNKRDLGYRLKRKHHLMYRFILKTFDVVVCASYQIRNFVLDKYNVPLEKTIVIYNGVNLSEFDRLLSKLERKYSKPGFGTCTLFRKIKGLDVIFRAISLVSRNHKDFVFHLVGSEDEITKEAIYSQIKELKIQDHVVFWGWQENIVNALSNFDFYVNASFSEGLSNAIVEAMACSLPVIASSVGGNKELVFHQKNGFLFEAGDYESLANYINILLNDSQLRKKMGSFSRQIIESTFDFERMISKYGELFRRFSHA